ncbi:MAG: hypothetical protein ACM31C_19360 [Acidobacteriota bacterium]
MKARIGAVILLTACSSGPSKPKDAAIDVPVDAAWVQFTGEYVDWDSTDTSFCGIFNATFQVHGEPARVDQTNPNGRFMLNVAPDTQTRVDITPPTANSECLQPTSNYTMPGIAIADPAVIATGQLLSLRDFSVARAATIESNYGTLDPSKGHVFVHVDGNQRSVSLSLASTVQLAWNGTTWTTGDTGVNVFFMNVPVGTTTVMMTSATGTTTVPVEAGTITYVTLVGN